MVVKFGIVGCGNISVRYIEAIKKNPKARLIATCDLLEERAKAAMEKGEAEAYYLDYNEMLEKANIDAVIITTHIGAHARLAIEAANAGKHMLVQKSMATSLEDADSVVNAVRKAGVKAVVEPGSPINPGNQRAKQLIEEGAIGKVCYVHGISSHGGPNTRERSWYYLEERGGGPIFDMGVYSVSHITSIIGPAKRVTGMATFSVPDRHLADGSTVRITAPDNTVTVMDFGEGTIGCVEANYVTRVAMPDSPFVEGFLRFYGSEGTMFVSYTGVQLASFKEKYWAYPQMGWFSPIGWGRYFDYYSADVDHLVDCILEDKDPLPNVEWGRHVIEILTKSLESARVGRTLDLTTTF